MIINEKIKEKLPIKDINNYYVVTDFDRTITNDTSNTSWSILASSDLVPKSYINERQKLYKKYRPIELDETMDFDKRSALVSEWFKNHIELFIKYRISEEIFAQVGSDLRIMEFRKGAKEFLQFLNKNNIPLIIISAGIGNFIESFLKKHDCLFDNIYISSNKIIFTDNVATGVDKNIIHSLNKNEVLLPFLIQKQLQNKSDVILLGDQISDLKMIDKNNNKQIIKVGFYSSRTETSIIEFQNAFDIVCLENDNYNTLSKVLFKR
ncbi:MAG: HAD-IB family phosphatase [Bacilli bacterium]|nr:HAD-IB family phosphatase [Bacilli bacterium]MDD3895603.1 HAD-IB family phosphatase [Bacilli bacterium]MDD4408085.1 HAD-IB family phosphatase [Bacilli bacterium]